MVVYTVTIGFKRVIAWLMIVQNIDIFKSRCFNAFNFIMT